MSWFSRLRENGGDRPRLLSLYEYARRYAELVRRRYPASNVIVVQLSPPETSYVEWVLPNGRNRRDYLGSWHGRYLVAPGQLEDLLRAQLVEAVANEGSDATEVAPPSRDHVPEEEAASPTRLERPDPAETGSSLIVLPMIKTSEWAAATIGVLSDANLGSEHHPMLHPLVETLSVAYAEDGPSSVQFVTRSRMAELGIDETELKARAYLNLIDLLRELTLEHLKGGIVAARLDGTYDASAVLLLEAWREDIDVEGELVVALPARDQLLFCDSANSRAVAQLRDTAAALASETRYALSTELFAWRDQRLQQLDGLV